MVPLRKKIPMTSAWAGSGKVPEKIVDAKFAVLPVESVHRAAHDLVPVVEQPGPSCGPPGACMTPSSETKMDAMSFLMGQLRGLGKAWTMTVSSLRRARSADFDTILPSELKPAKQTVLATSEPRFCHVP